MDALARRTPLLVLVAASIVSISSFIYFFSQGMTNNYGDGVAHVNIARKVVDSPDNGFWQRYIQIGSPWLPLQTVLMLPLVANDSLWRTGAAGSLLSMASFVVSALMLYLLASETYGEKGPAAQILALITIEILVLNPSGIYLQTTPLTEWVFIAALSTSVYLLQRWVRTQSDRALTIAGLAMAVATLSRYEAWPVAAIAPLTVYLSAGSSTRYRLSRAALFAIFAALGPAYWLWHNFAIYGDPLEFLTGPSSARGLYNQNRASLGWAQIFVGNALLDFAVMLTAAAVCAGPLLILAATLGSAKATLSLRRSISRRAPLLLLGIPFVFHVFSIYRGEIQVFPLSIFGLLNARYGLAHLPLIAMLAPASVLIFKPRYRLRAAVALMVLIAGQYAMLISEGPRQLAVFQEGYRNGVNSRSARELARLSQYLRANPPEGTVLMTAGPFGPVVPHGGLRFSNIIHEGTARWHRLDDGIPEDVSTVILRRGDPLDLRLQSNQRTAGDLKRSFYESYNDEGIVVLLRVRS
ncbi:MAG TPA: hypothetical protein VKM94_12180 [Blastocatellia bacterium]|nr:hypothetical protein [Blastocatellia bacterium]